MKYALAILTTMFLLFACTEDEPLDHIPEEETEEQDSSAAVDPIDMTDAFLHDFVLKETERESIIIADPVLVEEVEETHGTITIIVPWDNGTETYSLKEVNFDMDKFGIEPAVGEAVISPDEEILYTISSLEDNESVIHYDVRVSKAEAPQTTSFGFSAELNPTLTQDIAYFDIIEDDVFGGDSLVFIVIPEGEIIDLGQVVFNLDCGNCDNIEYKQVDRSVDGSSDIFDFNEFDYVQYQPSIPVNMLYPRRTHFRVTTGQDVYEYVVFVEFEQFIEPITANIPEVPVHLAQKNTFVTDDVLTFRNDANSPLIPMFDTFDDNLDYSIPSNTIFRDVALRGPYFYLFPGFNGSVEATTKTNLVVGGYSEIATFDFVYDYESGRIVGNNHGSPHTIDLWPEDFEVISNFEIYDWDIENVE